MEPLGAGRCIPKPRRSSPFAFPFLLLCLLSIAACGVNSQTYVSNCTELNNAIILTNAGSNIGTVVVKAGVTIDVSLCKGLLNIRGSIHISGQSGARITGKDLYRIFYAQNYNGAFTFRLSNLNINNGNISTGAESGGCVFIENGIDSSFTNVNFSNCKAYNGGAVYTSGGKLSISQCSFTSNLAYQCQGGAIYHYSASTPLSIVGSTFSLNSAQSIYGDSYCYGGAIYASNSISITSSTFSSNTARGSSYSGNGGAIYNSGYSIEIDGNSIFSRNEATSSIPEGYGGAISTSAISVSSSTFSDNIARGQGGAIYADTLNALSSTFLRNIAFTQGGAVNVGNGQSFSNITSCTFQGNQASSGQAYGGAICGVLLTIKSSNFILNKVTSVSSNNGFARGGAVYASNQITTLNSKYSNNTVFAQQNSNTYGGAIFSGGLYYSRSNTFENNLAFCSLYSAYGGSVYANQVNESFSSYTNNQVNSPSLSGDSSYGGAIFVQADIDLSFSTFTNNFVSVGSASAVGGAIFSSGYYYYNYGLRVSSSVFINNYLDSPTGNGGAIYARGVFTIFNSTFNSNFGKTNIDVKDFSNNGVMGGGAICSESNLNVDSSTFVSNFVAGIENANGGAISILGGTSYVNRSRFDRNYALSFGEESASRPFGGAISSNNLLYVDSCQFTNNQVQSFVSHSLGGAIGTNPNGNLLSVSKSSFTNNSAISNCITICSPENGGGGAIFFSYALFISQSTFVQNMHMASGFSPSAIGGAIFGYLNSYYQAPVIVGSSFTSNGVQSSGGIASGGAIYIVGLSAALSINSTTFKSNSAKGAVSNSGALFVRGGSLSMFACTFTANSAVGMTLAYGGAIDLSSNSYTSTIYQSSFVQNSAKTSASGVAKGGAIHFGYPSSYRSGDLYMAYVKFASNAANGFSISRGGSLHVNPYQYAFVSQTSFSGSSSTSPNSVGGAVYLSYGSYVSFCRGTAFSLPSNNTKQAKNSNSIINNDIDAAPSVTVKFCPKITLFMSPASTFAPIVVCDACDCNPFFNPCDPSAQCAMSNGITTCTCPSNSPGNGFVCGSANGLGCA